MSGLEGVASIIAVLQLSEVVLGACYRYAGKVKEAAADIDRIIHQVGFLTTLLQDLKELAENQDGATTATYLQALRGLAAEHGPLSVCAQCLEELKERLPSGPIRLRQKLQWPFESNKIKQITDRISAQIPLLEVALTGSTLSAVVDSHAREQRDKVLTWLRSADPTVKHLASRKSHQTGTNQWILENAEFIQWRDNAGQALWLYGIPGAGKTILCSTIIDHVEQLCKAKPHARLAYYYFDFSDHETQNLNTFLRCLLWQLSRHDDTLPPAVQTLFDSHDSGRKHASDEVLADALFGLLSGEADRPTYVIIDALDECPIKSRDDFCELILTRIEQTGQTSRAYNFLFTSRNEFDIEKRMSESSAGIRQVPIPVDCVGADVRLHVRHFISVNRTMKNFPQSLKTEIEDTVSSKAHGMFRWVVCQLDLIKDCKQVGKVRKQLKDLPETLDDTYDRILASIPDGTWQIARTALMMLTHSLRPLTLDELAEAMVIDYESQSFDPEEHRLTHCREALEICSSLVSASKSVHYHHQTAWLAAKNLVERRWSWVANQELELVQFAHFSVQEYMMRERARLSASPRVSRFCFSPASGHAAITELSLVYLLDFSGGVRFPHFDLEKFTAFPFLAYAAQFWPEHWQSQKVSRSQEQERVNSLIRKLLNTDPDNCVAYINYVNICRPDALAEKDDEYSRYSIFSQQAKSLDAIPQPLYYSAQLGHLELCRWLLDERGCDVDAVHGKFGQAIQIAALFGHKSVVELLLLEHGANLGRHCGKFGYPLQAAAYGGHADIVKLMLDSGADINAIGGEHCTALIAACDQQHPPVVKVLLDRGADMDVLCVHRGKALNIAAGTGNKPIVRMLLAKGADVNDVCGGYGTPLYAAAEHLDLEMVKMLVACGANVNIQCQHARYNNPLQAACFNARPHRKGLGEDSTVYIDIARFLLERGANPNLHGGDGGDALQAAVAGSAQGNSEGNNIDIVKLVIEHGAQLNHRGGSFHSAIRAAVFGGNMSAAHLLIDAGVELDDDVFLEAVDGERGSVVPRLLEKGVDVNVESKRGTALQLAIKCKDWATVSTLLRHPDIDVNAVSKGRECITALYLAVRLKNKDLVKDLLARGADPNQPSDDTLCLAEAVSRNDIQMATILLDAGADINGSIIHKDTALMEACETGNLDLVEWVLSRGADVNLWVEQQGDALQTAAHEGHENIVKLLLARGANVKAREGRYGSCLEGAIGAREKNMDLVQLLMDAGANVNYSGTLEDLRAFEGGFGSPLSGSIWNPRYDGLTRLLLERGADPNWPGRGFYGTALEEAVERDNEEAFHLLLEYGADVNQVGGNHGTALVYAIMGSKNAEDGDKYVRHLLEAGADVNLGGEGKSLSPLGAAVKKGDAETVSILLDNGANINGRSGYWTTPLHLSVSEGDLDIFRLLLERGADPNVFRVGDDRESSALCAAGRCKRGTMLKELLEHGADASACESAAVVSAARSGYTQGVEMLVKHGANIHKQQGIPGMALHKAAKNRDVAMVKYLLKQGVDVNARSETSGTALMAVLSHLQYGGDSLAEPVIQVLLDAGADVNSPPSKKATSALQVAILRRHLGVPDRLLALGADINAYDPRHGTALEAAARRGDVDLMKKFVARGADIKLASEEYGCPLQGAALNHQLDAVEYLLSLGADVHQLSGKTGYALHAASRYESEKGPAIFKLLFDHGADANARGGKYETALQAAARHGCLKNVKILLAAGADPTIEGGRYGSPIKAALAGKKREHHVANYLRRYIARMAPASA